MFSSGKVNFARLTASAGALAAASALIAACGQPPAPRPAAVASPTNTAPNFVAPTNTNGALPVDKLNQTQLGALLGNYGGSFIYTDNLGANSRQTYTVAVTKVAGPGGSLIQIAFQSLLVSFTAYADVVTLPSTPPQPGGNVFYLTNTNLNLPSFYPYGPVIFQMQMVVTTANQFDPASAVVLMVDPFSTSAGGFFDNVVTFNNDLAKR